MVQNENIEIKPPADIVACQVAKFFVSTEISLPQLTRLLQLPIFANVSRELWGPFARNHRNQQQLLHPGNEL